jgi:tetratricopeptide (TPR) repeat protein
MTGREVFEVSHARRRRRGRGLEARQVSPTGFADLRHRMVSYAVCDRLLHRATARAALCLLLAWLGCGVSLAQITKLSLEDLFRQGRDAEKREDYTAAEKLYQQAAADYPRQPEVFKRLGLIYQTELKFPESIESFEKALQLAPQYPEVNFYLGLSYFGLNQFQKALEAFDKELAANPGYRRVHYYKALAYRSLGQNSNALREYEILVREDPTNQRVLYQLIRLLKDETIQAIKQLGSIDPDSEYMLVLKAESYAEEQKYPIAIYNYKELLKKDPNFPGVHFALGELYIKKGDFTTAEMELRLALKEDPKHARANYDLAEILLKSKRVAEAIPHLKTALASDPQFAMAYLQLGKCYAAQGKLQDALKPLLKAAELEPKDMMTHFELAQVYTRLKQTDKARSEMAIYQKINAEESQKKAGEAEKSAESGSVHKTQ